MAARTDCEQETQFDTCSPCVENLVKELTPPEINIQNADGSYEIKTGDAPTGGAFSSHIQGIARLSDVQRSGHTVGRLVMTDNVWSQGLTYAEQWSAFDVFPRMLEEESQMSIRDFWDHPSGAQAQHNVVAVAMEGATDFSAGVLFYNFPPDSTSGEFIHAFILEGIYGEPGQPSDSAASAGFIRLKDGTHLLAVSGAKHGTEDIWFYRSESTTLFTDLDWEFIGHWKPPCTTFKTNDLHVCFGGASNMALLSDCTGQVYLVTMNGSSIDTLSGIDIDTKHQWIQIYRIDHKPFEENLLEPVLVDWQSDATGKSQSNNPAFRWSSGIYVRDNGLPVIFNTERRTNENHPNDSVDGDLYFRSEGSDTVK